MLIVLWPLRFVSPIALALCDTLPAHLLRQCQPTPVYRTNLQLLDTAVDLFTGVTNQCAKIEKIFNITELCQKKSVFSHYTNK